MLIEFSVENYKVFKGRTTLSMIANSTYQENPETQCVHTNFTDIPLSNAAIIYGANGAGKSSFIEALAFFKNLINQGFVEQEKNLNYQPFLFADSATQAPTQFELIFIGHDDIKYHYGLSLNNERVTAEFLLAFDKAGADANTLFSRVYDPEIDEYDHYHPGLNETEATIKRIIAKLAKNPKVTFLRLLCQYNAHQIHMITRWMAASIFVVPFVKNESFEDLTKSTLISQMKDPHRGRQYKQAMIELLQHFDLNIADITVSKQSLDLPETMSEAVKAQKLEGGEDQIQLHHRVSNGKTYPVNYDNLSSGSRKLINLCGFLYQCRHSTHTKVLVFDEIESSFHPYGTPGGS